MRRMLGPVLLGSLVAPPATLAADPDLVVDPPALQQSWFIEERYFAPDSCALVEGCVDAPGWRRIMRFDTWTANVAQVDLTLGDPTTNPLFVWSPCHGHYHFEDFADYQLQDLAGAPVAPGHKQAFCLEDVARYVQELWVPRRPFFNCGYQGIQRGWADVYGAYLDCQWIDITGVRDGAYTLKVTVNPDRVLTESNYSNNASTATVVVSDLPGITHRPDGQFVAGQPMRASREGVQVRVSYDVTSCPATSYDIYYGIRHLAFTYAYDGAVCDVGTSGDALIGLPEPAPDDFVWFVVVGTDPGASPPKEGGHGFDSSGSPRPLSGVGFCGIGTTQAKVYCSVP